MNPPTRKSATMIEQLRDVEKKTSEILDKLKK